MFKNFIFTCTRYKKCRNLKRNIKFKQPYSHDVISALLHLLYNVHISVQSDYSAPLWHHLLIAKHFVQTPW